MTITQIIGNPALFKHLRSSKILTLFIFATAFKIEIGSS